MTTLDQRLTDLVTTIASKVNEFKTTHAAVIAELEQDVAELQAALASDTPGAGGLPTGTAGGQTFVTDQQGVPHLVSLGGDLYFTQDGVAVLQDQYRVGAQRDARFWPASGVVDGSNASFTPDLSAAGSVIQTSQQALVTPFVDGRKVPEHAYTLAWSQQDGYAVVRVTLSAPPVAPQTVEVYVFAVLAADPNLVN